MKSNRLIWQNAHHLFTHKSLRTSLCLIPNTEWPVLVFISFVYWSIKSLTLLIFYYNQFYFINSQNRTLLTCIITVTIEKSTHCWLRKICLSRFSFLYFKIYYKSNNKNISWEEPKKKWNENKQKGWLVTSNDGWQSFIRTNEEKKIVHVCCFPNLVFIICCKLYFRLVVNL